MKIRTPSFLFRQHVSSQRSLHSLQVPTRALTSAPSRAVKNRIYNSWVLLPVHSSATLYPTVKWTWWLMHACSVRSHDEFNSLLLLSASSRSTLLTFWTATWCPSCRVVKPIVKEAIESGIGEEQGGVGFADVEFDAPGMGDLGLRYFVRHAHKTRHFRIAQHNANQDRRSTQCRHY